jgi:hypothetical protein
MAQASNDTTDGRASACDTGTDTRTDTRTDAQRRHIVDTAIALQSSSNTMAALEYLRRRDIAAGIITRVLLEPERRRTR